MMPDEKKHDDEKIVIYSYYNTLSEAYEAKNLLERNGISCFISNENMACVYPMFDSNLGGVRLHLFEKDIAAADRLLAESANNDDKPSDTELSSDD